MGLNGWNFMLTGTPVLALTGTASTKMTDHVNKSLSMKKGRMKTGSSLKSWKTCNLVNSMNSVLKCLISVYVERVRVKKAFQHKYTWFNLVSICSLCSK